MSYFYAFDRKQSLLLLFAGILLAVLVLMLGWIVGLLMRPPAGATVSAAAVDAAKPTAAAPGAANLPRPEDAEEPASEAAVSPAADAEKTGAEPPKDPGGAADSSPTGPAPPPSEPTESTPKASAPSSISDAIPPDAMPLPKAREKGEAVAPGSEGAAGESGTSDASPGPNRRYAVVLADFVVESKARDLVGVLAGKGYEARIVHRAPGEPSARMDLFTVILGDYPREETAEAAANGLMWKEHVVAVVRAFPAAALRPPSDTAAPPSGAEPQAAIAPKSE